jgi:hypothetical protein
MLEKLKHLWHGPQNFKARLSPFQRKWISRTLLALGCACFVRVAWQVYGGMLLALVAFSLSFLAFGFFVKFLATIQMSARTIGWLVLLLLGGMLNFTVVMANKGFMPCVLEATIEGNYCPASGAHLAHLGDWLFKFVSPGDIVILVGAIGLVILAMRVMSGAKVTSIERISNQYDE